MHDHQTLEKGQTTRYFCCQDQNRKKQSKKKVDGSVKNRDNEGMDRFNCESSLTISVTMQGCNEGRQNVIVRMIHTLQHIPYFDVQLPQEAQDIVRENLWIIPNTLAIKIQGMFPHVTSQQVYRAWATYSESLWKRAENQLDSARKLLVELENDVDILDVMTVDGVVALAWGLRTILNRISEHIVEIAIDATCEFEYVIYQYNHTFYSQIIQTPGTLSFMES